jgi:hypothetical protein
MADKDLTIKITTTADLTGADAAAAALAKVDASSQQAGASGNDHTDISDLNARLENLKERAKALQDNSSETEKLGEMSAAAAPRLDNLVNIQKAQMANTIAQSLGQIGARVEAAAKDFEAADPQFAKTLTNLSAGLNSATGALAGAAQGFAVGGPFGAAVGGLLGGAMAPLNKAFDDLQESLLSLAKAQAVNAEMFDRISQARLNMVENARTDNLQELYAGERDELEKLLAALSGAKQIYSAQDKAATAKRNLDDSLEISGGANPEQVKMRRADWDADQAQKAIARNLEMTERARTQALDTSNAAGAAADNELAKPEKKRDAGIIAAAAAARKAYEKADLDMQVQEKVAAADRDRVEAETSERKEKLETARVDRARRDDKTKYAKETADERTEASLGGGTGQRELDNDARSFGSRASAVAGSDAKGLINQISGRLKDGTDKKELDGISKEFSSAIAALGGNTANALNNMLQHLQAQAKRIAATEAQIKNLRTP